MIAAVAGTFNVLHDGHRALIGRAFEIGDEVYIGITSDPMASAPRDSLNPYRIREDAVRKYAESKNKSFRIFPIEDMYGPDEMILSADILVVSAETLENGKAVVEKAASAGKRLELSVVDLVTRKDGKKISSTDIIRGECSRNGDTDAVSIAVGSLNPVKIEAVRTVMERIYGQVRISAYDVPSGVPEQPFGEQTPEGAKNRARGALHDHDLSVGIEAGVFEMLGSLYDIQYCAVLDRDGVFTMGTGSGFRYPDPVIELVRGGMTVGEAMNRIYGKNPGRSQGAIGILSKGLLDRKGLTEQSVLAAMLPRIWDER